MLCAGNPRHELQREERDATIGDLLEQRRLRERITHRDDNLKPIVAFYIGLAGDRVRTQGTHLQEQLGSEDFAAVADFRPLFNILGVGKTGRFAGGRLHQNLVPGLHQRRNQIRRERHTTLAGKGLFQNADFHRICRFATTKLETTLTRAYLNLACGGLWHIWANYGSGRQTKNIGFTGKIGDKFAARVRPWLGVGVRRTRT